jgi:hypothetical protein
MQYLRFLTLGVSVGSLVLTQLSSVLPEGKVKGYVTAAGLFLTGLAINVFPQVKGSADVNKG